MTGIEKKEFLQAMKTQIDESVHSAVKKEVHTVMKEEIDKAINKAVDGKINIAIEKAIEPLRTDINELKGDMKELKNVTIPNLQKDVSELKNVTIPSLQKDVSELKNKTIPVIQEDINNISRSVAIIEVEHGRKLDTLFDAFTINSENIAKNEKRIISCEKKIDKHEGEIYYLKSNLKKV